MGILDPPSSRTPPTGTLARPAPSPDGAYIAPDRSSRSQCWEARDKFFACLDTHGIINAVKEEARATEVCGNEDREFMRECARSWVGYFKDRRVMEHNKKLTLERLAREGGKEVQFDDGMGIKGG